MISEPINVTDAAFQKTVLESPVPVIVDFGHLGAVHADGRAHFREDCQRICG